jgi:hypothetical protein
MDTHKFLVSNHDMIKFLVQKFEITMQREMLHKNFNPSIFFYNKYQKIY